MGFVVVSADVIRGNLADDDDVVITVESTEATLSSANVEHNHWCKVQGTFSQQTQRLLLIGKMLISIDRCVTFKIYMLQLYR